MYNQFLLSKLVVFLASQRGSQFTLVEVRPNRSNRENWTLSAQYTLQYFKGYVTGCALASFFFRWLSPPKKTENTKSFCLSWFRPVWVYRLFRVRNDLTYNGQKWRLSANDRNIASGRVIFLGLHTFWRDKNDGPRAVGPCPKSVVQKPERHATPNRFEPRVAPSSFPLFFFL